MELRPSLSFDVIGIVGIILTIVFIVLDKAGKLKGGLLIGLLCLAGVMTLFLAIGNSFVLDAPIRWKLWRGLLMFSLVALTYTGLAIWITGGEMEDKPILPTPTTQDEKPPTLLDLFKKDFPAALKTSDKEDFATITVSDGSTIKVKRQTYSDFNTRTKFVGFYISVPTVPRSGRAKFNGGDTESACMELLKHDAVRQAFKDFESSMIVSGGYGDQMTTGTDLTFSGLVLLYHEEFLSITQKAEIIKAYKDKNMAVTFRGTDYLGTQVIAWHQQHDKSGANRQAFVGLFGQNTGSMPSSHISWMSTTRL